VFIERGREALAVLRGNLDALEAGPELRIVGADAWRRSLSGLLTVDGPIGLAFVDPPYADTRNTGPSGKTARLLRRLVGGRWLRDDAVIVLHHERGVRFEPASGDRWVVADRREYGSTTISFLARAGASAGVSEVDEAR
jgi:16S rRNA G966 N2-methylase RsmD